MAHIWSNHRIKPVPPKSNRLMADVYLGPDGTISALTDDGVEELTDMIQTARNTTKTWHEFLDDFIDEADLISRIKAQSQR
jgi:hypothetical protein